MRMQYTIRRIPRAVDDAIRERARATRKSLNETAAVDALAEAAGIRGAPRRPGARPAAALTRPISLRHLKW